MLNGKFQWQEGYGAFSYGRSQQDDIYNYIKNQEEYHSKQSFKNEYGLFLEKFEIEYNNEYLFKYFD